MEAIRVSDDVSQPKRPLESSDLCLPPGKLLRIDLLSGGEGVDLRSDINLGLACSPLEDGAPVLTHSISLPFESAHSSPRFRPSLHIETHIEDGRKLAIPFEGDATDVEVVLADTEGPFATLRHHFDDGRGAREDGLRETNSEPVDNDFTAREAHHDCIEEAVDWLRELAKQPKSWLKTFEEQKDAGNAYVDLEIFSRLQKLRALRRPGGEKELRPRVFLESSSQGRSQQLPRQLSGADRLRNHGDSTPPHYLSGGADLRGLVSPARPSNLSFIDTFPSSPTVYSPSVSEPPVRVGPKHQAVLPEVRALKALRSDHYRHGVEEDDDSDNEERWLGTQVWPPRGKSVKGWVRPGMREVGRGREECSCEDRRSLTCTRLHVQEADERLEAELGPAYEEWGFHEMGEKVSDSWTHDEEDRFLTLTRVYPQSRKLNFWHHVKDAFPGRSMKEIVSYYFNVFVYRRRAAQNRFDVDVDSDDDEIEYFDDESAGSEGEYEENLGRPQGEVLEYHGRTLENGVVAGELSDVEDDEYVLEEEIEIATPAREEGCLDETLHIDGHAEVVDADAHSDKVAVTLHLDYQAKAKPRGDETDMEDTDDESELHRRKMNSTGWGLTFPTRSASFSELSQKSMLGEAERALGEMPSGHLDYLVASPEILTSCEPCVSELWEKALEMGPRCREDRFISTNGVMKELFGDEQV